MQIDGGEGDRSGGGGGEGSVELSMEGESGEVQVGAGKGSVGLLGTRRVEAPRSHRSPPRLSPQGGSSRWRVISLSFLIDFVSFKVFRYAPLGFCTLVRWFET
jgi:hypothetical protein